MNIRMFLSFTVIFIAIQCTHKKNKAPKTKQEKDTVSHTSNNFPKFEFNKEIHKFGVVLEGEIAVCDFYYKNVGKNDLIISSIQTNCGCAVVKWDKKPLKSNAESKLTVEFNSQGKLGTQFKTITIFCNTLKKVKKLIITAEVK